MYKDMENFMPINRLRDKSGRLDKTKCTVILQGGTNCGNVASYVIPQTEIQVCGTHRQRVQSIVNEPLVSINQQPQQPQQPQQGLIKKASSYPSAISQEGSFYTPEGSPTETPVKREEEQKLPVEYLVTPATMAQPSRTLKREVSFKKEPRKSIESQLEEEYARNLQESADDLAEFERVISRQVSQISDVSQFPLDQPYAELERSLAKLESSYADIPQMSVPVPDPMRVYQQEQQEVLNYQIQNDVVNLKKIGAVVPVKPTEEQQAIRREQYLRERLGVPRLEVPIPGSVLANLGGGMIPVAPARDNVGSEFLKIRISALHPTRQKRYTDLFNSLNQYIGDIVRARDYLDTNYIFGQIQSEFGDVFDQNLIELFLVPVFERMEAYNNSGFGMLGYNPVDLRFPIIVPEPEKKLFTPPPQNVLPGTNNEIIFENIPDGSSFSQFMGKYGNIKHPEFPPVELTTDKKVISDRYVCTQKVGGKLKSRRFSDVYQAKGWALRGGFYADKIEQMRQTKIQGRYDNKFRVIPTIVR